MTIQYNHYSNAVASSSSGHDERINSVSFDSSSSTELLLLETSQQPILNLPLNGDDPVDSAVQTSGNFNRTWCLYCSQVIIYLFYRVSSAIDR